MSPLRKIRSYFLVNFLLVFFFLVSLSQEGFALEMDWSGQFWSEYNFIHNYAMDSSDAGAVVTPDRSGKGGYYAPGGGNKSASFQSLFLRLRPKLIVNDNIYVKSEFWVGDPIFGIFGNALPYSFDQRQYYSHQSRGSTLSAQRFWGEFVTDIGTFQAGRLPLDWGLGVVWNKGDALWSRYMSTGDAIRWIAKFGSFTLVPSFIVPSTGNTIAGTCSVSGGVCTPGSGSGGVADYSLIVKYESSEDELEGGVNIIRRLGGPGQDQIVLPGGLTGTTNFNTYDLFVRKSFNNLTLSGEIPVVDGTLGSASYRSFAIASEADWKVSDVWAFLLKAGYAPGQENSGSPDLESYRAFYFNPNYHVAMILFNYQLANFAGAQTLNNPGLAPSQLSSPYDNPIVNAGYLALATTIKPSSKWTFKPALIYAHAPRSAKDGDFFLNYWTRSVQQNNSGKDQGQSLGWELDLGVTFQWDEYFQFSFDNGIFFPGSFYAFSNTSTDNQTSPVFASSVRVGINF